MNPVGKMRIKQTLCRGLVAITLALLSIAAHAERLSGTVVDISDGDTLRIKSDDIHKIRLKGIDAPEMAQSFGPESRRHLVELTFMKEAVADCPQRDHYGRLICTIYIADPACTTSNCPMTYDVNLAQVKASLAWWYRRYADEQSPVQRASYELAEERMRLARLGLWSRNEAMAPWAWRRR